MWGEVRLIKALSEGTGAGGEPGPGGVTWGGGGRGAGSGLERPSVVPSGWGTVDVPGASEPRNEREELGERVNNASMPCSQQTDRSTG